MSKRIKSLLALIMAVTMVMSLGVGTALAGDVGGGQQSSTVATEKGDTTDATIEAGGEYVSINGLLGSWKTGGKEDYQYYATILVDDGTLYNGTAVTTDGTVTASSATGITIVDPTSGHNGIIIIDADYAISNATITMETNADGSNTCDFSGVGSAIAVYGDSVVTISDSTIITAGVATMPIFVDNGATVTVDNTTLVSKGGTLYKEYMNSPDQATMVAPPWILGIMGTSRTTNLMGTNSTMNFTDSTTSSGAWAVLSTDSGSNMYLNIYNTSLTLLNKDESAAAPLQVAGGEISATNDNPYTTNYGSGYGTYAIGAAVETFAGATINVGTYATIFTGGSATYTGISQGQPYMLQNADGSSQNYVASKTAVTTINSDTFGFMIHQSANTITIENGTVINSGYATFLVKSGSSDETVTATIDRATINNGGVLIQVMDNDDATNGGMMAKDDELNTNGSGMNFIPYHTENAGFNTAANENTDETVQSFTFTNGDYSGNIYNASGSDNSQYGPLAGTTLKVALGTGATLSGAVASTSAIHVTYDGSVAVKAQGGYAYDSVEAAAEILEYQNTYFTIDNYYDIGQVANLVNYNGANDIEVTLADDAVWTVTGTSVVTKLTVSDNAKVIVPKGTTLTVGDQTVTNGEWTADGFVANPADPADPDNSATDNGAASEPAVGDSSNVAMWAIIAALALAGVGVVVKRRRFN